MSFIINFPIHLIWSKTELTTAVTDALIAIECIGITVWLLRSRVLDGFRQKIWCSVFLLTAISSLLGAFAHGLQIPNAVSASFWPAIYLSLGLLVALFFVGAIADWRGTIFAARLIPWSIATGLIFFALTRWWSDAFIIFVIYETAFLFAALAIYSLLACIRRLSGAAMMVFAILLNLIAAAVQASNVFLFMVFPFDHNGIFHILQMVAIAALAFGLHRLSLSDGYTVDNIVEETPNAGL